MNRVFLSLALVMALPVVATAQPDTPVQADPESQQVGPNPQPAVPQPESRPVTPENAARFFVQIAPSADELHLSMMVAGVPVGYFGSDEWIEALHRGYPFNALEGGIVDAADVVQKVGDDSATVEVTMHLQTQDGNGQITRGEPQKYMLLLRRETVTKGLAFGPIRTYWRVVPPPIEDVLAKPLNQTPPLELVAAIATHDPRLFFFLSPLKPDQQDQALTQLKQLGLGAAQFVQDYDLLYAFDDAASVRALEPYTKSKSLFLIPEAKGKKWHFNDNLSNAMLEKINNPAKTVMFYDGEAPDSEHLNFRFDGKTAICFADGHAAALSKDEARGLVWKP